MLSLFRTPLHTWLPFLGRRQPTVPRAQMLALRPQRNPSVTWQAKAHDADKDADGETDTGGAVLSVPRRQDRWTHWLARWLTLPPAKRIELDEFGAAVWEQCDGAHTVEQLVGQTCTRYKLNRRQGEVSVLAFMRMLAQRRLIGFAAPAAAPEGKGLSDGSKRPLGANGRKRINRDKRPAGSAQRRRH